MGHSMAKSGASRYKIKGKGKSKTLKCRGRGGSRGFFGVVTLTGYFRRPAESSVISQDRENVRSALHPQKSSAAFAFSAFQGFAFGFDRRTFEVRRSWTVTAWSGDSRGRPGASLPLAGWSSTVRAI